MDDQGKIKPASFFLGMLTLAVIEIVGIYTTIWVLGWV